MCSHSGICFLWCSLLHTFLIYVPFGCFLCSNEFIMTFKIVVPIKHMSLWLFFLVHNISHMAMCSQQQYYLSHHKMPNFQYFFRSCGILIFYYKSNLLLGHEMRNEKIKTDMKILPVPRCLNFLYYLLTTNLPKLWR